MKISYDMKILSWHAIACLSIKLWNKLKQPRYTWYSWKCLKWHILKKCQSWDDTVPGAPSIRALIYNYKRCYKGKALPNKKGRNHKEKSLKDFQKLFFGHIMCPKFLKWCNNFYWGNCGFRRKHKFLSKYKKKILSPCKLWILYSQYFDEN